LQLYVNLVPREALAVSSSSSCQLLSPVITASFLHACLTSVTQTASVYKLKKFIHDSSVKPRAEACNPSIIHYHSWQYHEGCTHRPRCWNNE